MFGKKHDYVAVQYQVAVEVKPPSDDDHPRSTFKTLSFLLYNIIISSNKQGNKVQLEGMTASLSHNGRPTCPCKILPRSFSSFTAAEYGDLQSLTRHGWAVSQRRDEAGYSPLHFSAQQNNVAATALLLQLGCPVDGGTTTGTTSHDDGRDRPTTTCCGATPLHRAAYSGAVASMRVLLEWEEKMTARRNDDGGDGTATERCNLLARDTSFGDDSTPLHKAAAGGRYLAVHLLLEALRGRPTTINVLDGSRRTPNDDLKNCSYPSTSMLSMAISAVDRWGKTPLDVARYYFTIQDSERQAVARWDEVAGGFADWGKCIQLLEAAMKEEGGQEGGQTAPVTTITGTTKDAGTGTILPTLPSHLTQGIDACLVCNVDDGHDGSCLTASWVSEFQKVLDGSVRKILSAEPLCAGPTIGDTSFTHVTVMDTVAAETGGLVRSEESTMVTNQHPPSSSTLIAGASCSNCHKVTIVLFPLASRVGLVCKACRRTIKE